MVKLAIQGCVHGDFDECLSIFQNSNLDCSLLLWCGDVQTLRTEEDFNSISCPKKYQDLKSFPLYYNQIKEIPLSTIFISGNHENYNVLSFLIFGGWVAPNLYYMGKSGIINYNKVRIAGLSGVFKSKDYRKRYYDYPPFNELTKKSVYSIRNIDVLRLVNVKSQVDILLTHDWPSEIFEDQNNVSRILKKKPFLKNDIEKKNIGNLHSYSIATKINPSIWFAAHLHLNFETYLNSSKANDKILFVSHDKPKSKISTTFYDTSKLEFTNSQGIKKFLNKTSMNIFNQQLINQENYKICTSTTNVLCLDVEWLFIIKKSIDLRYDCVETIANFKLQDSIDLNELSDLKESIVNVTGIDIYEQIRMILNIESLPKKINMKILSQIFIPIPDWKTLDYRDASKQLKWWLDVLGQNYDMFEESHKINFLVKSYSNPLM